jgi:hypothetical protein
MVLLGISFPAGPQTGYIVGGAGYVFKTTDTGVSWTGSQVGISGRFNSVCFPMNVQTGYAVGSGGAIRKTTDGGVSWVGQNSGTTRLLSGVCFPLNDQTGYAVGDNGTILKTTDGGASGVEENAECRGQMLEVRLTATPNPFTSFATVPGHSSDRFALYDIAGRRVGTYKGERIGMDLRPGVYFIRSLERKAGLVRIVKVR